MKINNIEIDENRITTWPCPKEEMEYLYLDLNLSISEISQIYNKGFAATRRLIKEKYQISKSLEKEREMRKRIAKQTTSFNRPEVQMKCRAKIEEKYGGPSATCSREVLEKVKETNIKKFGMQSAQRHLSKETRDIINDETTFQNFIKAIPYNERTYHNIAKKLGMHHSQIGKRTRQYKVDHLIHKNPLISQYERNIHDYILNKFNLDFEYHNRDQIVNPKTNKYMELDLFYRDKKLAIEFNSTRWHSDRNNKGDKYHQKKMDLCIEKDIKLLFLWQKDFNGDQSLKPVVEETIDNFIKEGIK